MIHRKSRFSVIEEWRVNRGIGFHYNQKTYYCLQDSKTDHGSDEEYQRNAAFAVEARGR